MAFSWCMQLIPRREGLSKGAVLLEARWKPGRIITISFLDDLHGLSDAVRAVADSWLTQTEANLEFQWRKDTTNTDLRISFRYAGSWSLVGTYAAAETDPTRPTMNFGWLDVQSSPLEIQEVVLHEFGHALGLVHEHQNPASPIPWDRDAVIHALSGPPNNWTVEQIEDNVLRGYDLSQVRATRFDPASIMLYPVDPAWTIGGFQTQRNTKLSPDDVQLIREIYGRG